MMCDFFIIITCRMVRQIVYFLYMVGDTTTKSFNRALFAVFILFSILAIFVAFNKYLVAKDYIYLVEAHCDSKTEICHTRDCSNIDDCPPNNFTDYKLFEINALDYRKCYDNSCRFKCDMGTITCIEILCGESEDDKCSEPNNTTDDLDVTENNP